MLGFINEVILLVIVGTKVTLIHIHVILPRQRKLNFRSATKMIAICVLKNLRTEIKELRTFTVT